jgi:surface antigen
VQLPVPPPHLAVGDTFAFDDGRMERVTALSAGTVQWHGQDDFAYTTFVDVLAPRIAWHGGTVRGERRFAASPTSIFPLSAGRVVVFDAERRLADSGTGVATTVAETWSCRTNGTARIATPAGTFDTFRVDCTLTTQPLTPALTRSFYYAPAVNYFVRRDDETENGTVTSISLTGFATAEPALPAETERLRSAARQSALESTPSGQALPWRDDVGGMSGTVRPTRTMQSSHRGWCRSYAEEIEANARRYRFERLACRVGKKAWQPVAG